MKVKQRCSGTMENRLTLGIPLQCKTSKVISSGSCALPIREQQADLNEHSQAVVGIAGRVQVVLVLLCDVRHEHVHQRLYRMIEGGGEALVPGELESKCSPVMRGGGWGVGVGGCFSRGSRRESNLL